MTVRTSLTAIMAIAMLAIAPAQISHATDIATAEDGKRKINLSGRQRMLSQRMAKAVCFAALDVQTSAHLTMISDAHSLFDTTLKGLRAGDETLGMNPEKTPRILAELDAVDTLWERYGATVASAKGSSAAAQAALEEVGALNVPVLVQMNKAVGEFERHYGSGGEIHPVLALALNVAGRQRMLTQKASKEFCLIAAGQNVDANRAALAETVALFETSLLGLMDGNDEMGLVEAPTDEIYGQLETVLALWEPLKPIFEKVAGGGMASAADLERVARDNNPLLVEMNRAVGMYENI
jgi:hypothetical protein